MAASVVDVERIAEMLSDQPRPSRAERPPELAPIPLDAITDR